MALIQPLHEKKTEIGGTTVRSRTIEHQRRRKYLCTRTTCRRAGFSFTVWGRLTSVGNVQLLSELVHAFAPVCSFLKKVLGHVSYEMHIKDLGF